MSSLDDKIRKAINEYLMERAKEGVDVLDDKYLESIIPELMYRIVHGQTTRRR